jgi:cell division protein FtsI (penicillin-binding protein 3)
MVLVEIDSGDVLAAAQWHRDAKSEIGLASTPYQSLYEPGSIVKPLVAAYALELGRIDWDHVYDCSRGGSDYRSMIAALGRAKPVLDDHDCHDLTPHGILVNSSNIGASFMGLQIQRDEWREYMRFFGFGESLGLPLPNEPGMSIATHGRHSFRHSFDPKTPIRRFMRDSAISFSFGYEFQTTAMQMARAYLRMLRGDTSELRLCRGVEQGGDWVAAPVQIGGRRLRPDVVHRVLGALIDVVSDTQGATGSLLVQRMKKELGVDLHGVIAGKTGTAVSTVYLGKHGKQNVRNASFVGVMPAEAPKWLAVCVLQRDDDAKFYGGSYAAPPVVRLLLRADQLTRYRAPGQDPQSVSSDSSLSPVDSGWSRGAPEKSVVGR